MPLNLNHPTAVEFAGLTRVRYGRLTAFRLGHVVGGYGHADDYECPYPDPRGRRLYAIGVQSGREWRERCAPLVVRPI